MGMPMMHTGTMTSDLQVVSSTAGEEKQYISFPLLEPVRMDWAVSKAEKSSSEKADGFENGSRPPSPPESGTTTPRLSIAPCPIRLQPLIPPMNYGAVDLHNIYRSSFPQDRNVDFLHTLRIKTTLTLVDTEPSLGYKQWKAENAILSKNIAIAPNKDGNVKTTIDSLCEAILFLLDSSHYPLHIHCNQGRHRTGCVVACLRKVQRVPLNEILIEYSTYAGVKARPGDVKLITSFDPDSVFDYAKAHGYFDGSRPQLKRLDSTITNIDALAAALVAGAMIDDEAMAFDSSNLPPSSSVSEKSESPLEMARSSTGSNVDTNDADMRSDSCAFNDAMDVSIVSIDEINDNSEMPITDDLSLVRNPPPHPSRWSSSNSDSTSPEEPSLAAQ